MPDPNTTSGEINTLILGRLTEVANKVESVANGQSAMREEMRVSFNDGTHRMNGLEGRIVSLEKGQDKSDDSDWPKPERPGKHRAVDQRDVATDRTTKPGFKIDMPTLIKIGMLIGAVLAGYMAAGKVG